MTTAPTFQDFEAAADWLDEPGEWDAARKAAFLDWLAVGPHRLAAVQRVLAVMGDPMLSAAMQAMLRDGAGNSAAANAPAPARLARRRFWPQLAGIAAGLGALAVGLGQLYPAARAPVPAHWATANGQVLAPRLADGSLVHLDPDSELSVAMEPHARKLELARGRGLFEVAHAPDRPFTVRSGPLAVTAVGTVFSVDRQQGPAGATLVVRVEQGRVRVAWGQGKEQGRGMLAAGQGLRVAPDGSRHPFAFHPDAKGAADDVWLVAEDERLDTVLARLQRLGGGQIACAPELAGRAISGRFRRDNVEASLRLIALGNGWRLSKTAAGWRLLPG